MIREKTMKIFREYKEKYCNEKGDQEQNLKPHEIRGLRKLRKRVQNKSIVVLKTDKSGKLTTMKRDLYEKMGSEACKNDPKLSRQEIRTIEKKINDHARMWTKMLNSGVDHDHMQRIMDSKQSVSENIAPKYFMFKDHKVEGGFRPVVGGCNSDTLGLSNTLSEVVESVCMATNEPYEVISSEDMLARVYSCNEKIKEIIEQRNTVAAKKKRKVR